MNEQFKNTTDEELVNRAGFVPGSLSGGMAERAPVEMMRRLKNTIEKSGEQEERFSMAFLVLGFVQMVIALIQFAFDVQSSEHQILGLASLGILAVFIVYIIFSFEKIRQTREKEWKNI